MWGTVVPAPVASHFSEFLRRKSLAFMPLPLHRSKRGWQRPSGGTSRPSPWSVNDGSAAGVRELWGWRHPPEGHRAGSRPKDARGQEQPSRSSEPSDHRLLGDGWAQGDGAGSGGADTIVTGKRPASPSGAGPAWPVLWNLTSRPDTVSSTFSRHLR